MQSNAPTWASVIALLVSGISLFFSWRNRVDQRLNVLSDKRVEIVSLLSERLSKVGQLQLICCQKILLLRKLPQDQEATEELGRLQNNLSLLLREEKDCQWQINKVRDMPLTGTRAIESVLSTATEFLTHITGELEKEQRVFQEFKEELRGRET